MCSRTPAYRNAYKYPPTLRSRVTACESAIYPDYLPVVFPVISGVQGRVWEGSSACRNLHGSPPPQTRPGRASTTQESCAGELRSAMDRYGAPNHSDLRTWLQNDPQSAPPGSPKGDPNPSKILIKSSLSRRGLPPATSDLPDGGTPPKCTENPPKFKRNSSKFRQRIDSSF